VREGGRDHVRGRERPREREGETMREGGRDHTRGRERPREGETAGTTRRTKSGGNGFKLQLNKARMAKAKHMEGIELPTHLKQNHRTELEVYACIIIIITTRIRPAIALFTGFCAVTKKGVSMGVIVM